MEIQCKEKKKTPTIFEIAVLDSTFLLFNPVQLLLVANQRKRFHRLSIEKAKKKRSIQMAKNGFDPEHVPQTVLQTSYIL